MAIDTRMCVEAMTWQEAEPGWMAATAQIRLRWDGDERMEGHVVKSFSEQFIGQYPS